LIITGLLLVTASSLLLISPAAYFVAYHLEGFEATPFLLGSSVLTGALGLLPWVLKSRIPGFIEEITGLSKLFAPYAVSAFFLMGGLFCVIYTETDVYRTEKKFALELGAAASGIEPENICFFMKAPAKTVFYMARSEPLRVVNEKEVKSLDFDGNGFFVFQRKYIKYLPEKLARQLKGNILISEKFYNWERDSGKKLAAVEYSALAGQGATFPDKSPDNGNTLEEKHPNGIVNGNQEEENE
jgi:hypothetical protein